MHPTKRWMTQAQRMGDGWRIAAPVPVGDVGTLLGRLVGAAEGGPVALGLDVPLGVPRAYAARHGRGSDFPAMLRGLADRPGFFQVAETLAQIGADRPFYPRLGAAGMTRAAHAAALGLADAAALSRVCDRATPERPAGAPVFWTLGANQSGKAALAAWRELLIPALTGLRPPALWPFDGDFRDLLRSGGVAVAETYPAEAMRHLTLRMGGSKRRQDDRRRLAPMLAGAMARLGVQVEAEMTAALTDGFGADAAGEDRFDSVLGVLCVIGVLEGRRSDAAPADPWIRRWEGWVLGQADPDGLGGGDPVGADGVMVGEVPA